MINKRLIKDKYTNSKFRLKQLAKYTIKIGYKVVIVSLVLKLLGVI